MKVKKWINKVEKEIEDINSSVPSDRLEYTASISQCNDALLSSCSGWNEWLKHSTIMNKFSIEEINQMHVEFKEISTRILKFDIKWTESLMKKLNIKDTEELEIDYEKDLDEEENEMKVKNSKGSSASYIS